MEIPVPDSLYFEEDITTRTESPSAATSIVEPIQSRIIENAGTCSDETSLELTSQRNKDEVILFCFSFI